MALSNKFLVNCLPSEYFLQQSTITPYPVRQKILQFGYYFGFISLYLGSNFSSKPWGSYVFWNIGFAGRPEALQYKPWLNIKNVLPYATFAFCIVLAMVSMEIIGILNWVDDLKTWYFWSTFIWEKTWIVNVLSNIKSKQIFFHCFFSSKPWASIVIKFYDIVLKLTYLPFNENYQWL